MKFSNDPLLVRRTATFSPCREYRYTLDIIWDESRPVAAFIGLNPSNADEFQDDPTLRRCRGFAETFGCGGLRMLNLFAYRATDPKVMKAQADPVGEGNNLVDLVSPITGPIIACWGTHGKHMLRGAAVAGELKGRLMCLGRNFDTSPKHPLYISKLSRLEIFA